MSFEYFTFLIGATFRGKTILPLGCIFFKSSPFSVMFVLWGSEQSCSLALLKIHQHTLDECLFIVYCVTEFVTVFCGLLSLQFLFIWQIVPN